MVVERVGQPVTKVVNPLGTVITVLADEEDISSSQEFDDATPEPPRSVCAEEGPASLGDFDSTEGQDLRNLTEICAEMRSASEPAIDSVPDESIKDVKERKTLCVEAATMNTGRNSIDFERTEAFRDVPTSLSLCAEQGEIPSSPMTQARENTWSKRTAKREDSELQERTFAKAKYVVSYDEDSVVLMEKKSSGKSQLKEYPGQSVKDTTQLEASSRKSEMEPERATKRPGKLSSSARATKRSTCGVREQPKYLVHEHEDSIVIEDTSVPEKVESKKIDISRKESSNLGEREVEDFGAENPSTKTLPEVEVESEPATRRVRGKDRRNSKSQRAAEASVEIEAEAMVVEKLEPVEAFVDLKDVAASAEDETVVTLRHDPEPMEAMTATGSASLPPGGAPPLDDIICMDYHIVEASTYPVVEATVYSHQSDDDIEHIHSSEVTQMLEIVQSEKSIRDELEVSPIRQRKSSKGTISDDDLEHINSSELAEVLERGTALLSAVKSFAVERNDPDDFHRVRSSSKSSVLAFDDDVEHVYHSEITELQEPTSTSPAMDSSSPRAVPKKSQESERTPSIRARGSRKRKDVVVIDSDTSEAEVTVIVKSLESWSKSKTPEKDLAEEIDRCAEPKDHPSDQTTSQSLPKKTRVRTAKSIVNPTASQKRQPASDMIEIIDIDAMQKAEMEVASECSVATPECKILETRHDTPTTRSQKSRRNKKAHIDSAISVETPAAPMEAQPSATGKLTQESDSPSSVSWSSVVRKPEPEPEVPVSLPEESSTELRVVQQVEEKIAPEISEEAVQVECEESSAKVSAVECRVAKSSELPEKIVGSKKRGKKTRIGGGSGADSSAGSPVKSAVVELPPIVEGSSCSETARRGSRGHGKTSGVAVVEDVKKDADLEIETADVKMIDETMSEWKYDAESAPPASLEPSTAPTSKDNSPEPEVQIDVEVETEKRVESDHEAVPERSSSSDDLNANVVPMDTTDHIADAIASGATTLSWSSVNKKNTRSKKKKRR